LKSTLTRLLKYSEKIFKLRKHWSEVRDARPYPEIPASVFPAAFFAMFCCRIGSFNELEQQRGDSNWRRWLGGHDIPSADELAYVSERIKTDDLRNCLGYIYGRLKRNKILQARNGWMLAAIDGHEIGSSYHRSSENCLERQIEVGGKTKTQYYNRQVSLLLISEDFEFFIDMEMQRPGEDEVATAIRLINRVVKNHPRCFDLLVADALYLRPSVIACLQAHGKHLIAVLKKNQAELLEEAQVLMELSDPLFFEQSNPKKSISLRDMEGFTTESIVEPIRIVWAHEQTSARERVGQKWKEKETLSDWFWATTIPQSLAPAKTIWSFGHERWKIENEGFNELVTHWNANHYFHHHENSIGVMWLMLFMAHAVYHCFYLRNLKAVVKKGHSVIYFAHQIAGSMRTENWWPPPIV